MKILFVASDFARSGASLAMAELAGEVKRMGHDVLLLYPARSDAVDDAVRRGLDCRVVRSYEWLAPLGRRENLREKIRWALKHLWNQVAIRRIAALIEKERIDIVHINSLWGYVGAVAARRTHAPYVWHMRELLEQQRKRFRWEKYAGQLVGGAEALFAISKLVATNYTGRFPPGKIHLVYDGVDVGKMYRKNHKLFQNAKTKIIVAGGVRAHKRQLDVVQAVEILARKGMDLELSIVGADDTPYADTVRAYIREKNLGKAVFFRGETPDMPAWWEKSDIAVTSSQFEGFGRVTAEAMLAGCVAVVSNSGANEEIVTDGETGYVYEVGNPNALAAALERILSDKEKAAECAAAGRESVARRFGSGKNAREVVDVYASVLENRPCGTVLNRPPQPETHSKRT
jgi:hypothetical protein